MTEQVPSALAVPAARSRADEALPLVCLPGMACNDVLWDPVAQLLATNVVHASLAGASIDAMVAHVLDRAPPFFDLAGLSLGGIIAMEIAVRVPSRVRALALLATNPRPPTNEQLTSWRSLRTRIEADEFLQCGLESLMVPATPVSRSHQRRLEQMVLDTGKRAFEEQLQAQADRRDLRPLLPTVRIPTLVLAGGRDHLCSMAMHREIADALPDAQIVGLPEAGHLMTLDQPDCVAELLVRFL